MAVIYHLGCSFSGVVEPGASEEHVELFPRLASRLFQVQIALDLWTAAGVQKVLQKHRTTAAMWITAARELNVHNTNVCASAFNIVESTCSEML